MTPSTNPPRFPHGRVFMTSSIVSLVREGDLNVLHYLERHLACDWGDVSEARKDINDAAVDHHGVLISRYRVSPTLKIVIVTNEDRSLTKLMMLDEFLDDIYS